MKPLLAIQRWWFRICHPEFCYKCGGRKTLIVGLGYEDWWCEECRERNYCEYRERTEARYRELFGGRK